MIATIKSYPNLEIDTTQDVTDSLDSAELIQTISVPAPATDTYIEIVYNGITTIIDVVEECRYTPVQIKFRNKQGVEQRITFFKAKTQSLSVTKSDYENDIDFVYNVNGRTRFKVNSGFYDESQNELFRQLILSEWVYFGDIPLKVSNTTLEYKTRQKDRLINYEFEFEYAVNEIQ